MEASDVICGRCNIPAIPRTGAASFFSAQFQRYVTLHGVDHALCPKCKEVLGILNLSVFDIRSIAGIMSLSMAITSTRRVPWKGSHTWFTDFSN